MNEPQDLDTTKSYTGTINQLGSLFKGRREKAYTALQAAPFEHVRPLLMRRLTRDLRANRRRVLGPAVIAFSLIAINAIVGWVFFNSKYYISTHTNSAAPIAEQRRASDVFAEACNYMMAGIFGMQVASMGMCRGLYRRMWNAATLLTMESNPITAALLCEIYDRPMYAADESFVPNQSVSVRTAWVRMLSTVKGDSANNLSRRHRRILRSILGKMEQPGYKSDDQCNTAIAIMQCLAAIGDLEARPIVEQISKWTRIGPEQAVSAQAMECLRTLDLIKEQARTGAVLLRSSSDPGTQAENLLRGANESAEVDAAELLRADQMPVVEVGPVFSAKSYSVKPETEEVLKSKVGRG